MPLTPTPPHPTPPPPAPPRRFLKRVRSDKAEFKAFKEQWLAETLPAWLTQRGSSLDYYHSMAWLEKHGV